MHGVAEGHQSACDAGTSRGDDVHADSFTLQQGGEDVVGSFRKSVFGLLGLLLVSEMMAAPVGVEKAIIVANRFFDSSLWASKEVRLVYPSGEMRSSASSPCYVFENGEGNGFVVVSGDDRGAWCRWSGYSGGGYARRSTLYEEDK